MQTVLKLILLSFVVGLIVAVAGVEPMQLWNDLFGTVSEVWHLFWDTTNWAVKYVVLGAIIVIPLWIILTLLQKASEARGSR